MSAAYYFLFRWPGQNGLRVVDFCGSRPHLVDGVFRHKLLWGAEPALDPWRHTLIAFLVNRQAALPEVVTQQLVLDSGGFRTLGECLRRG